jgi:putative transposase
VPFPHLFVARGLLPDRLIRSHAKIYIGPRRRRAFDRYRKLRPHLEEAVPLTRVAAEAGLPLRTAQRWVS